MPWEYQAVHTPSTRPARRRHALGWRTLHHQLLTVAGKAFSLLAIAGVMVLVVVSALSPRSRARTRRT